MFTRPAWRPRSDGHRHLLPIRCSAAGAEITLIDAPGDTNRLPACMECVAIAGSAVRLHQPVAA